MGTPKKLSSEWARKKGFDLAAWDFHGFSSFGNNPRCTPKKSLPSETGGMSGPRFLRKWRMLAGSLGPVAERHSGWFDFERKFDTLWESYPHEKDGVL